MRPPSGTNRTATQVAMKVFAGEGGEGLPVFNSPRILFYRLLLLRLFKLKLFPVRVAGEW